ncbi:MAG: TlpA disulfide reductase family protein [Candidatus Limnocylindrales bacterium]
MSDQPADRWRRQLIGPFTVAQVLAVVASVTLSGLFLFILTTPLAQRPNPSNQRPGATAVVVGPQVAGLRIGDQAPEFTGTTPSGETVGLFDLAGNPIRLADLRGRPVWINFWATWCPPCQEETPILREMHDKYADEGLALVAISVQESTAADVQAYVDRYELGYIVGFDATSAIFHTYHAFALPTQIFLDRDGRVSEVILGPITRDEADSTIRDLLDTGAPTAPPTPAPTATAATTPAEMP